MPMRQKTPSRPRFSCSSAGHGRSGSKDRSGDGCTAWPRKWRREAGRGTCVAGARETGGVEFLIAPEPTPRTEDRRPPGRPGRGAEQAPRQVPDAAGALRPRRDHPRGGRAAARPAGGDDQEPPVPGAGRLRSRLVRRGLTPAELFGAGVLTHTRLPDALVDSTVRLASQFLAGQTRLAAIAATSASVAALTQGVIESMFLTKLKIVAMACLVLAAGSASWSIRRPPRGRCRRGGREATSQAPSGSEAADSPASDDELDVLMLERAWLDALGRADKAVVSRILADDFLGCGHKRRRIRQGPVPAAGRGQSLCPGPVEPAELEGPGPRRDGRPAQPYPA